jgi:DegV family protein with EDD domain
MPKVRIVTDSACDIPPDLAQAHNIDVVPLSIRFGNEEYTDRVDLTVDQFWAKVAASKVLPETAAPAPGLFEAAFRRAVDDGCDAVVCVNLSSKLSATIGSAQLAARSVSDTIKVHVVDSLSITMGQGTMALEAAKLAASGTDAEVIVSSTESLVPRTRVYGALNTLDNLKKGGRIGGAQALVGSLLSVKPILDLSSGAVEEAGKQRTRTKSLQHLAQLVAKAKTASGSVENVSVMHGNAPDIDDLLEMIASSFPKREIIVGQIGAVIGAHGGPGVVGLTFNLPVSAATSNPA